MKRIKCKKSFTWSHKGVRLFIKGHVYCMEDDSIFSKDGTICYAYIDSNMKNLFDNYFNIYFDDEKTEEIA